MNCVFILTVSPAFRREAVCHLKANKCHRRLSLAIIGSLVHLNGRSFLTCNKLPTVFDYFIIVNVILCWSREGLRLAIWNVCVHTVNPAFACFWRFYTTLNMLCKESWSPVKERRIRLWIFSEDNRMIAGGSFWEHNPDTGMPPGANTIQTKVIVMSS